MANTTVETGSVHNVLNWERKVGREILKRAKFTAFWGKDTDAGIRVVDDLSRGGDVGRGAGDTVYTTFLMNLTGGGVAGDSALKGNEEALVTHRQTVIINQIRQAVKSDGAMSRQRTFLMFKEESRPVLQKWGADKIDLWAANQLAGNTGETNVNNTGMQTPTAPTSATGNMRIIYGPSTSTTEASLSASAGLGFQITMLDKAVNYAEVATPAIGPMMTANGPKYVVVLHPDQAYALKTDATAARVTWYDTQKAIISGGGKNIISGNPHKGALGEYNDVIIHVDSRIPLAPGTTRVRRAVFFGAQAGTAAFGRDGGNQNRWKQIEDMEDYGNQVGVGVKLIGGMKKNVYDSIDLGSIVLSTFASV